MTTTAIDNGASPATTATDNGSSDTTTTTDNGAGADGTSSAGSSGSGAAAPPPNAGAAGAGTGLYEAAGNAAADPAAFAYVIEGSANGAALAGLPGTSLAYFSGTDVSSEWSTGVPYSQASANGWLLRDQAGNLLVNQGYAGDYVGDVGNAGYQQAWISNVLSYLASNAGVKGVFIDDVLYDLKPLTGQEAAEYPTQQAWAQAQLSFVEAAGSALRSHGYYVLVNAGGYIPGDPNSDTGANTVAWWQMLGPYVNGLMNEYYDETSDGSDVLRTTGPSASQNWDGWQALVSTAQAMGDDFFGVTYSGPGDTQAMTYGKASFLLDWNGGGGAFIYHPTDNSDPSNSAWTTDIGQPAAAKQQVGVGWMRQYSAGVALVDPDPSSPQTFQLPGSYLSPSGATISSITLEPGTAAILQAAG